VQRLPPGSTVVLCTDGLVERCGPPQDEGLDWLPMPAAGLPLEQLSDALLAELLDGVEAPTPNINPIQLEPNRRRRNRTQAAARTADCRKRGLLPGPPSEVTPSDD
jgi:hypothetical protein